MRPFRQLSLPLTVCVPIHFVEREIRGAKSNPAQSFRPNISEHLCESVFMLLSFAFCRS